MAQQTNFELANLRGECEALRRRAETLQRAVESRDARLMAIGRAAIAALPPTDDREENLARLSWDEPLKAEDWVRRALAPVEAAQASCCVADDNLVT